MWTLLKKGLLYMGISFQTNHTLQIAEYHLSKETFTQKTKISKFC
jgi:hypothetical protein